MKARKMFVLIILPLLLIIGSCSFSPNDILGNYEGSAAKLMIPHNAVIVSAELYVNVASETVNSAVVNLYRVTAPWIEYDVTWGNFAGAYDTSVILDSVIVNAPGWYSFNIKDYLTEWVDGKFADYGLLLDQADTNGYVKFNSREFSDSALHPYIKVSFLINGQLLEEYPEELTADAYIWEYRPDYNGGNSSYLYTGVIGKEKQTLVKFQLEEETDDIVGTGTPGYWKNHPESWPVEVITIDSTEYSKEKALEFMWMPIKSFKWFTMFKALVAAKLNVLAGADDTLIADTITKADNWLINTSISASKAKNDPWKFEGEELYILLDDYNNGLLEGAPSRDTLE